MNRDESTLICVDREDPEWKVMFRSFPDTVMLNEQYGEVLQYMGTVVTPKVSYISHSGLSVAVQDPDVVHQFRHRAVPGTNERQYWNIPASYDFKYRLAQKTAKVF